MSENQILIDELNLDQEQLIVRGKDLNDMTGNITFISAIYHVITGMVPCKSLERKMNKYMNQSLIISFEYPELYQNLIHSLPLVHDIESFVMMSILYFESVAHNKAISILADELNDLRLVAEGIFLMSLIPVFLYCAVNKIKDVENLKYKIEEFCTFYPYDYCSIIYALLSEGKKGSESENSYLLDCLLVSLHAGFGIITPTIALSRFSASTRAPIAKNILAGLTGCGKAHVGACKLAMSLLLSINNKLSDEEFNKLVIDVYCRNKPYPGFGHPILNKDPRNEKLLALVKSQNDTYKYISMYEKLVTIIKDKFNLNPNIDLIAAALLLDLNISNELGTSIFLFARIPTMLAHIQEKLSSPAFGINSKEAREHFGSVPKRWI